MPVDLKCVVCGKPFSAGRVDARTCSQACRTRMSRRRRSPAGPAEESAAEAKPIGGTAEDAGAAGHSGHHASAEGATVALAAVPDPAQDKPATPPQPAPASPPAPATPLAIAQATKRKLDAFLANKASKAGAAPPPAPLRPLAAPRELPERRYDALIDAVKFAAEATSNFVSPQERLWAAIGSTLNAAALPEPIYPIGAFLHPLIEHGLGPGATEAPAETAVDAPPQPWERTPTERELATALARLDDGPTWERVLATRDLAICRFVVALTALAEGGPVRPHPIGPKSPFRAGIVAIDQLAVVDQKLRAGIDRAEGAHLIAVRLALRLRHKFEEDLARAAGPTPEGDAPAQLQRVAATAAPGPSGSRPALPSASPPPRPPSTAAAVSENSDAGADSARRQAGTAARNGAGPGAAADGEVTALRAEVAALRAELDAQRRRVDALVRGLAGVGEV